MYRYNPSQQQTTHCRSFEGDHASTDNALLVRWALSSSDCNCCFAENVLSETLEIQIKLDLVSVGDIHLMLIDTSLAIKFDLRNAIHLQSRAIDAVKDTWAKLHAPSNDDTLFARLPKPQNLYLKEIQHSTLGRSFPNHDDAAYFGFFAEE